MIEKDSISFKDIFKQTILAFKYLLSKWIIIVIAGIAGGVIGLIYAFNATPTYSATLNFVLSSNSSTTSGLAGFVTQFGVNLGSDNDVFSGDNIITLMKSAEWYNKLYLKSHKTLMNLF